jgi:Na+-translocating ferredoxin:NAD+ oxidoreductase RnfC subunit
VAKVGNVRDIVNMQLSRWEAAELLNALTHAPTGGVVTEIETRLMEILTTGPQAA